MTINSTIQWAGILLAATALTGCVSNRDSIVAITSTTIGIHAHQKDAQQTPEVKIGYNRQEIAIVPTDKMTQLDSNGHVDAEHSKQGASSTGEVVMEIKGDASWGLQTVYGGGIYQRLAVGSTAVKTPGAAALFAKDNKGAISAEAASAIKTNNIDEALKDHSENVSKIVSFVFPDGKFSSDKWRELLKGTLLESDSDTLPSDEKTLRKWLNGKWVHHVQSGDLLKNVK